METTVSWYNSGSLSRCWSRRPTDYDELVTMTVSTSKARIIWRILLRKIKRAKKNIYKFSDSTRFRYEAGEYAQNFDHGLMSHDSDDLSRSFSARFAAPNSAMFHRKR
ncbi:hypothetical protein HanOQP8_Chr10g0380961 [Helianthus annuus]|nr:hypothetical protein HanOQP8_Chr10g0380961 [Helianthus annuus]